MNKDEILNGILELGLTKRFYVALYDNLMKVKQMNPREFDKIMKNLEKQNFKNIADLAIYLES